MSVGEKEVCRTPLRFATRVNKDADGTFKSQIISFTMKKVNLSQMKSSKVKITVHSPSDCPFFRTHDTINGEVLFTPRQETSIQDISIELVGAYHPRQMMFGKTNSVKRHDNNGGRKYERSYCYFTHSTRKEILVHATAYFGVFMGHKTP